MYRTEEETSLITLNDLASIPSFSIIFFRAATACFDLYLTVLSFIFSISAVSLTVYPSRWSIMKISPILSGKSFNMPLITDSNSYNCNIYSRKDQRYNK